MEEEIYAVIASSYSVLVVSCPSPSSVTPMSLWFYRQKSWWLRMAVLPLHPGFWLGWRPARPELLEPSGTGRLLLSWWCSSSCLCSQLPWLVDKIQSAEKKPFSSVLSCGKLFPHPSEEGLKLWCGTDFWNVPDGSFINTVFWVRLCSRLTWFKCRWLL